MLFAGREVRIERNCALGLCKDLDLRLLYIVLAA